MSDLMSIFGDEPDSPALPQVPSSKLQPLAAAAAKAADDAAAKVGAYKAAREALLAKLDAELEPIKLDADKAQAKLDEYLSTLESSMKAAKVTEVELSDRPAVKLKTIKGRKEQVTKERLSAILGKSEAQTIWDKVPNKPDTYEVVIPILGPPE